MNLSGRTTPTSENTLRGAVALLAAFALGALWRAEPPRAWAQSVGRGEVVAITAPGKGVGQNVLFVIDGATQHLLVYEHTAAGALELAQSRDYTYDLRLSDFPSQEKGPPQRRQRPSVKEIKAVVK